MPDKKPSILVLIDWYLPGFKAGGPIRSIQNLVLAIGEEFQIYIATTNTDHTSTVPYENIESDVWIARDDGSYVYYFSHEKLRFSTLRSLMTSRSFDWVYVNSMYSLPFTIWPLFLVWKNTLQARIVLAPRGMLQRGAVRIKYLKKIIYLTLLKWSGVAKKISWHGTDEQEVYDIQHYFGKGLHIRLASNIPTQYQPSWVEVKKEKGSANFVFSSRVSPKKNLHFFLECLAEVSGDINFEIWGPVDDAEYWEKCETAIRQLPEQVKVQMMGSIPHHELLQKIQAAHFSVLTTHAENFGHAIFEGMLVGKPVIISNNTPWLNLAEQKAGWDFPLENRQGFIDTIQACIDMDQQTYNEWSRSAWDYAKAFKDSPQIKKDIIQVFS